MKPNYDEALSNVAYNSNLRHYMTVAKFTAETIARVPLYHAQLEVGTHATSVECLFSIAPLPSPPPRPAHPAPAPPPPLRD